MKIMFTKVVNDIYSNTGDCVGKVYFCERECELLLQLHHLFAKDVNLKWKILLQVRGVEIRFSSGRATNHTFIFCFTRNN